MAANVDIRDGLLNLWHVATDAFATRRARFVMRMLLDRCGSRSLGRVRAMAFQAHDARWFQQISVVRSTVNLVTAEARDAARVHHTCDKVIALHSILVRRTVWEVGECSLPELVLFQFPRRLEILSHIEAHRPVVIFPLNRIL